jgi:hypothetical protein
MVFVQVSAMAFPRMSDGENIPASESPAGLNINTLWKI